VAALSGLLGTPFLIMVVAAFAEIAGCFAFWAWARLDKSPLWLAPGVGCLLLLAWLLTLVPTDAAGRTYAIYGCIYIVASMVRLWAIEGVRPTLGDIAGSLLCLAGAATIFMASRS